jgi:hypothetical protein
MAIFGAFINRPGAGPAVVPSISLSSSSRLRFGPVHDSPSRSDPRDLRQLTHEGAHPHPAAPQQAPRPA